MILKFKVESTAKGEEEGVYAGVSSTECIEILLCVQLQANFRSWWLAPLEAIGSVLPLSSLVYNNAGEMLASDEEPG